MRKFRFIDGCFAVEVLAATMMCAGHHEYTIAFFLPFVYALTWIP